MAALSQMKLTYFAGRGVIEPTRIMLAIAKVPYEDFRYPIDPATYARPEFTEAQSAGAFALGMNKVPILEVDGGSIAQSKAIDRFVARRYGFMGASDLEAAQIDMIGEHCSDIKKGYGDARAGKKDEELAAAKVKFLAVSLAEFAAKVEASLALCGDGAGGFAVGGRLSYADVRLFDLFEDFFDDKASCAAAIAACPRITASVAAVKTAAATWLASRPVTAL